MKRIARTLGMLLLLTTPALAMEKINTSGPEHLALQGYDPVAFFTDSKPVMGSPDITAMNHGATYRFASEEHRKLFQDNPHKYSPQFGGFCAYGVGVNALFPVEIDTWQVRNGKLYLNKNSDVLARFNADFEGNVAKAEKNWPELGSQKGY